MLISRSNVFRCCGRNINEVVAGFFGVVMGGFLEGVIFGLGFGF